MKHNKIKNWLFLAVISLALFLPVVGQAGTINLPKTGQTKCYDTAGTEVACAGTGQDGEIQAGGRGNHLVLLIVNCLKL